jgi:hypothetical protein
MASNKNQHFVPRCYLKAFTVDKKGKFISLFNLDREKIIEGAPVKNQCSRDYFYGTDQLLEDAIQSTERAYASIVGNLVDCNSPVSDSIRKLFLRFFLLQQIRTEAASRRAVEIGRETNKLIGHSSEVFTTEIKTAVKLALAIYAEVMSYIDDLKIVLVNNKTNTPFVTSDDPAIIVNRWAQCNKKLRKSRVGLNSAGLICVLPVSPEVCCYAYDSSIYSIQHKNNWISCKKQSDIDAINDLQFLNCFANIYFNGMASDSLYSLHHRNRDARTPNRHRLIFAIRDKSEEGYKRYEVVDPVKSSEYTEALIHTEYLCLKPHKWPSFLRWKSSGHAYYNNTGLGYIRQYHVGHHSGAFQKVKAKL